MYKILIDTNILIDYSKGYHNELKQILNLKKEKKVRLFLNAVIITEFLADFNLLGRDTQYKKTIKFINLFENYEITRLIALKAAELLREKQAFSIIDSIIAATCLVHDLQLFTRNKKDFQRVKGLKFYHHV